MKQETQFDQVAATYDEDLETLLSPYMNGTDTSRFAEYKIQLLHDLLKRKNIKRILDFGCGTGRSLVYLKKYFKGSRNFYGCDVSSESIKIASKVMPEAYLFVNSSTKEFNNFFREKGTYDLVFLACVLHHIEPRDRKKWIRAVLRSLKPGGYIAVFEHNLLNPYTKKIVLDPQNTVDDIRFMLTQKELMNLLLGSAKEMKVVWKGYTLFSLFRPSWILKAERMMKWCPLGAQHCVIAQKRGALDRPLFR